MSNRNEAVSTDIRFHPDRKAVPLVAGARDALWEGSMAKRVNLDAMIPREDFGVEDGVYDMDLIPGFPITSLNRESPMRGLLRKPDFQRETNHWTPEQVVTFIASFLDNELIPSLILWKSPRYVFVIDGGHRLSALRAWMEDDYGDEAISKSFYNGHISRDQAKVAKRTRELVESKVGRYSALKGTVDHLNVGVEPDKRAARLFTRALTLQWVQGNASVAETSFFKINSQGTPLDETEQTLIRNRKKAIAISARAVLRSGTGHKYWSAFDENARTEIERRSSELFKLLFQPETDTPLKTLDVPLGGSVSPVDALGLLVEFLTVASSKQGSEIRHVSRHEDDEDGSGTIDVLRRALSVSVRITGNQPASLGLHPAVYFYNERGKHSQFLFLGITYLFAEKLRNNDDNFWKTFTSARLKMERFLIENKSLIGIILQNLSKGQRVSKMRDLFDFLIARSSSEATIKPEDAISHLGLKGRIYDVVAAVTSTHFSDDTKSEVFVKDALKSAMQCTICGGFLDVAKSVSYDHKTRVREGGSGDSENLQMVHPFCNSGVKA